NDRRDKDQKNAFRDSNRIFIYIVHHACRTKKQSDRQRYQKTEQPQERTFFQKASRSHCWSMHHRSIHYCCRGRALPCPVACRRGVGNTLFFSHLRHDCRTLTTPMQLKHTLILCFEVPRTRLVAPKPRL